MNTVETQHEVNGQRITLWCEICTLTIQFTALVNLVGTDFFLVFKPERFDSAWNQEQREAFIYDNQQAVLDDLEILTKPLWNDWRRVWPYNWTLKLNPNGEHTKLELWEQ